MTETLVPQAAEAGPAPAKRLFIKTYGCQMNVYDSERMADVLRPLGYATTEAVEDADFVILNTCHIREKAAEKVYSELGKMRELKDAKDAIRAMALDNAARLRDDAEHASPAGRRARAASPPRRPV